MKHLNFRIYSLILACTCMVGCAEQFDEAGQADKAHMLGIAVLAEIGDSGRELPELAVTMTNPDENYTVQGTIKNGAVTVLNDVMPGIYNVTVSGRSSDGIFAGGLNGIELFETRGTDNPLRIPIKITEVGALCFKEIFYNSSTSFYKKDQYYEIYNNSDHVYYLDNLCITTLQPDLSSYPSEFMTWNEPDADEYVYATINWRIKGTGQQYPLQPGQSVIIASIAANHQQINADGGPTVDLTSAEFEGWIPSISATVGSPPCTVAATRCSNRTKRYYRPTWPSRSEKPVNTTVLKWTAASMSSNASRMKRRSNTNASPTSWTPEASTWTISIRAPALHEKSTKPRPRKKAASYCRIRTTRP